MKKNKKIMKGVISAIVAVVLLLVLAPAILNQTRSSYENLSELDQSVLRELNVYMTKEKQAPIWKDFKLSQQPILAINKKTRQAFLVNAKQEVHNFFAKEITLPKDFSIRAYRISATAPQMLQFLLSGNFNTFERTYTVFGNSVYFTKYTADDMVGKHNSSHYITLLTHEAFHNITQAKWPNGGRFETEGLSADDLNLMEKEYAVLEKINNALREPDKSELTKLAAEYVEAVRQRINANPQYMKEELQAETNEGTATYIGVQASKAVGYDFKIMHFDGSAQGKGIIEWPFDSVVNMIRSGTVAKSAISTDLVYSSGGLLCQLLDALDVPNWQSRLNGQTKENPVTLYALLNEYVSIYADAT